MKSIWNGTISFGLVNIPVKLYSAINQKTLGFRLLCKKCMTPVHYKRYCEGCKGEVAYDDTIKALDLGGGEYLPFTEEELKSVKPEKTDRIEISEIINAKDLKPIYYNKFYFCAPPKKGDRSYFLFRYVLQKSKKAAVGKFVMREKEYVCVIEPYEDGLTLATLNYTYEIRDIADIASLKESPKLSKEEIALAEKLVDQLYQKEFDLSDFKDTFAEQLKEMIQKKEKIVFKEKGEAAPTDEKSLLDALKQSLS